MMNRLKRVWKIVSKILFWIFFISLFFLTVITVVIHIYQDDIKQFAISELNSYLKTDVEVMDIEVSIFHDFPNASIEFENVFIADAFDGVESNDTLLFAKQLFFHFNLMDIWSGDYKVKRASVHNGQLNLRTTDTGDVNYAILEESNDSTASSDNFEFLLELLKLENIDFSLKNKSTNQDYELEIEKALIRGDFSASAYSLLAEGDLHIKKLKSGSLTLMANKAAEVDLALDINTTTKSYQFKKGELGIAEMQFSVSGAIDSSSINLEVVGREIEVAQLVSSIMPDEAEQSKKYNGKGIINFIGHISGELSRVAMPSIDASFALEKGSLTQPENNLTIYDINLLGSYANAYGTRKENLNLSRFSFKLLNSHLSGVGRIEDFAQPDLITEANGDLDLKAFHQFFGFKNVEELAGNVKFDLACIIRFFDPEYRKDKFEILRSDGSVVLSNVVYKSTTSALRFTNISGEILIKGKDAATKDLTIQTQQSDILLNGAMKNLISYIDGTGSLGLIASLESSQINLNEFLGPANKDTEGPPTLFQLPGDVNLNIEMNLKKFLWDKHTFTDISGQFLLANRMVNINNVQLKTLDGTVKGKLILNNLLENGNVIDGEMEFMGVNAKTLFSEWDNFQQNAITDQHIAGKVSGNVNFLLVFNPYFSLIEDKIFAISNVRIVNGELNNLETMKAITDYMRSNKALKLMLNKHIDQFEEKLMHLKFSQLENRIEIKDRRITIPKMTIKSNALDVDLFGWHDFDNNIEYHFSFRFRQLKTKPEYTEFGKIEDDGLGLTIYLTMFGNIDEPQFSLDSDERKNDIKESLATEKSTIKSMLKTEFGLFQKDSTVKSMVKDNKTEVEFIYYDVDVENETQDTINKKNKNKKRSNNYFDKFKTESEKNEDNLEVEDDL